MLCKFGGVWIRGRMGRLSADLSPKLHATSKGQKALEITPQCSRSATFLSTAHLRVCKNCPYLSPKLGNGNPTNSHAAAKHELRCNILVKNKHRKNRCKHRLQVGEERDLARLDPCEGVVPENI
jgi:hypothetical protein